MAECVFDASVVGYANNPLEVSVIESGVSLVQIVDALESVVIGHRRLRCNPKLLTEYSRLLRVKRNDLIEQFVALLDSPQTIMLKSSSLRNHEKVKAKNCKWPSHDQHVLAAAIGGTDVAIYVTEAFLGGCAEKVWRIFRIRVHLIQQ